MLRRPPTRIILKNEDIETELAAAAKIKSNSKSNEYVFGDYSRGSTADRIGLTGKH